MSKASADEHHPGRGFEAAVQAGLRHDVDALEGRLSGTLERRADILAELMARHFARVPQMCNCAPGVGCKPMELGSEAAIYFSVGQVCLHETPVFRALDMVRAEARLPSSTEATDAAEYIVATLDSRRRRFADARPRRQIISIGETCLPKTVPTKWGLKPPKSMGELTMPFDLAIHSFPGVTEILSDRFATYLDDDRVVYDATHDYPVDTRRFVHWNHETGQDWAANGYARLKETYRRRIRNLEAAAEGHSLWFMCTTAYPSEGNLDALTHALGSGYGGPGCRLALLASDPGAATGSRRLDVNGADVAVLNLPLPDPAYQWYLHTHFAARSGLEWERRIMDWLRPLTE